MDKLFIPGSKIKYNKFLSPVAFLFSFLFAIKGILFVHFIILEKALIKILGRFFKIYLQIQYYIFFFSDSFKILLYKYNFQFSYLFFDSMLKKYCTL